MLPRSLYSSDILGHDERLCDGSNISLEFSARSIKCVGGVPDVSSGCFRHTGFSMEVRVNLNIDGAIHCIRHPTYHRTTLLATPNVWDGMCECGGTRYAMGGSRDGWTC